MRSSTLVGLLLVAAACTSCTGAEEPAASSFAVVCEGGAAAEQCLDALQRELSRSLGRAAAGGEPLDHDDLEQVLGEVVRAERIRPAHSYTRVTELTDRDLSAPAPTTPVAFRLGVGSLQRTLWACLPTAVVVTPGPCPPTSSAADGASGP